MHFNHIALRIEILIIFLANVETFISRKISFGQINYMLVLQNALVIVIFIHVIYKSKQEIFDILTTSVSCYVSIYSILWFINMNWKISNWRNMYIWFVKDRDRALICLTNVQHKMLLIYGLVMNTMPNFRRISSSYKQCRHSLEKKKLFCSRIYFRYFITRHCSMHNAKEMKLIFLFKNWSEDFSEDRLNWKQNKGLSKMNVNVDNFN